ncbi:MAG: hypothetical protein AAF623_14025 [Planctomycetota bacterium]
MKRIEMQEFKDLPNMKSDDTAYDKSLTKKTPILILGPTPPPVGGVTVHVQRFLEHLERDSIPHRFCDIRKNSKWRVITALLQHNRIHLHTSNGNLIYLTALACKLLRKSLIFTYHGNFGRSQTKTHKLEIKAVQKAFLPLALNPQSLEQFKTLNSNAKCVAAFVPPLNDIFDNQPIVEKINVFRVRYPFLYCTNASYVSFDQNGNEVYGITDLVEVFDSIPEKGLVFSDPTGQYKQFLKQKRTSLPPNVLFLNELHDFVTVIKKSDCLIRYTSTDGDSLSVKESLFFNVPVIATDVVDRPEACHLVSYGDKAKLAELVSQTPKVFDSVDVSNGYEDVMEIYKDLGWC